VINYSRITRTPEGLWSGTTADWAAVAPIILPLGNIGIDTTAGVAKLGDGTSAWTALSVLGVGTGAGDMLAANNLSDVASVAASRANLGLSASATRAEYVEHLLNGGVAMRSTIERSRAKDVSSALTSGVMHSSAIYLEAGDVITDITYRSVAAAASPANAWFALYDTAPTPALIAQTADQGSAAWASNTTRTLPLSSPYTVVTTGIHYVSIMVAATTVPTLVGWSGLVGSNGVIVSGQKSLAQTSGSGLTGTAPATITGGSVVAAIPYVVAK